MDESQKEQKINEIFADINKSKAAAHLSVQRKRKGKPKWIHKTREEYLADLTNMSLTDQDRYFSYWELMKGREFKRRSTGNIVEKVTVWNNLKGTPDVIVDIINDKMPDYQIVDKEWWENGVYNGPIESEIKNRIFKNCPENNKKKVRFKND
jgi:hypothetical protein